MYPKGVVEDVLVKVDKLIFPADFFVLDMEHDMHAAPILHFAFINTVNYIIFHKHRALKHATLVHYMSVFY